LKYIAILIVEAINDVAVNIQQISLNAQQQAIAI